MSKIVLYLMNFMSSFRHDRGTVILQVIVYANYDKQALAHKRQVTVYYK
ncbi:MAG: hypothetical protein RR291_00110 [Clostridia bacterium]